MLPILIIAFCLWNQAIYMTVKKKKVQWKWMANLKRLAKFFCWREVSLYRGFVSFILLLLGQRKSFLLPSTSLYRGSLYPGCIEKKVMKIPKMSGGVNLAARVGRTFLKANLLVLKTKKIRFSRFLTSVRFRTHILLIFKIKNVKKWCHTHINSNAQIWFFVSLNPHMLKIHENNREIQNDVYGKR